MKESAAAHTMSYPLQLGAHYQGDQQCSFAVWAPKASRVELSLQSPHERIVPLKPGLRGYHAGLIEGVEPGATYWFRLDGELKRPDPASRSQPEGVHGPSEIVHVEFAWGDKAWFGLPLRDYIIYELHIGTFTAEGTFDAIVPHLPELKKLGITALELMPLAQFPGSRNWGYDGVFPYAVQNSYGGCSGLKRLVNACHLSGLAVILDVVYNHLGPEGNYFSEFGPYFTDRYRTPWGPAINFDGEQSDEVRRFFLENALYWFAHCHVDALRLDAVHAIKDFSAVPFLQQLARAARRASEDLNRRCYLIAESDLNDARIINPEALGGYGLDAQWSDDFHHSLHVLLTGERDGYYSDFGGVEQLARVWRQGWAYTGEYSVSRRRSHGNSPRLNPARQFVVFCQNHDQIGNRLQGDRLSRLANLEGLKLAAGAVLLSPFIPLLFMGEEYGERAPFQYVTSHTDPQLVEAVRQGRRQEFAEFAWRSEVPDPQAEATFRQCILDRELCHTEQSHRVLFEFYRKLIQLRKEVRALARAEKESLEVHAFECEKVLQVLFRDPSQPVLALFCFGAAPVRLSLEMPSGGWRKLLDSAAEDWGGVGGQLPARLNPSGLISLELEPQSLVIFQKIEKF